MSEKKYQKNGSGYITSMISSAIDDGSRTAVISGAWEIDREIRLPSNFTLILENCELRMADDSFCNMFVNENHGSDIGKTPAGTDRNISIIGRGAAVLDGGKYNGLSERNQLKDGRPPIWKNNLLLFTNVEGFKVSDISCVNQRWWALNFVYCSNGYVGNVHFCSNDTAVDPQGNVYHGLKRAAYNDVLVKNSDGVDLRRGCHDIVIENITGFTEDDSVALTALNGNLENTFGVDGLPCDIFNVTIRNVRTAAYCTNVRLLNQGDIKLHDILIDGVYDTSAECERMDRGIYAVRVGDNRIYGTRHATKDETYNITIRNVRGRGTHVISLAGEMDNLVMYGIEAFDGAQMLLDDRRITE